MIEQVFDLEILPVTQNSELAMLYSDRPKSLTLKEFENLQITGAERILRDKIYEFEALLFANPKAIWGQELHEHMVPVHRFSDNIYTRELTIPAGNIVIGKRHSLEHQVMLIKGSCICITERGIEHMTAPMHFTSPAGEKRIVYTNKEDAVWVTVHPNPRLSALRI